MKLPASRKIYVEGTLHPDVRVPMREISVHPTAGEPPLPVYDSSGPYTDPERAVRPTSNRGLPQLRRAWILARGDVEEYDGREIKPEDNGFVEGDRLTPEFPVKTPPAARQGRQGGDPARLCPRRDHHARKWNSSPSAKTSCASWRPVTAIRARATISGREHPGLRDA